MQSQKRHNRAVVPLATQKGEGRIMQVVLNGYRGISLLVGLNWDRLFVLGTIIVGLLAGAFLGSAIVHH